MRLATHLSALLLVARLADSQVPEGVQLVGSDNARVTVFVMKDSAFLSLMMPDGSGFVVRTDSATMATWADNADLLPKANAGARVQGITFARLSADSNPQYRVTGEDGERRGTAVLDRTRRAYSSEPCAASSRGRERPPACGMRRRFNIPSRCAPCTSTATSS